MLRDVAWFSRNSPRFMFVKQSGSKQQLIMPDNVVEGYEGERQDESKEYAQPELNPAIGLSLLGCIDKRGAFIAHWTARLGLADY